MRAEECLREGDVRGALELLQEQVRKNPSEAKYRVFLFQLLAVLGDWDRALTQLNVLGDMDAGSLAMVQTYRDAVRCEPLRTEVFHGLRSPLVFGEPEQWIALVLQALQLTAQGEYARSQELREQAFEAAPATSGTLDGVRFEWIADADSRIGPLLEAIVDGRYYWIPFHRIRQIQIEEPADLRDFVWTPAYFQWANRGETVGLIPTRYAGSESSDDGKIQLARRTAWNELPGGLQLGLGQRFLATDAGEHALMDARLVQLETSTEAADSVRAANATSTVTRADSPDG